MAGRSYVTNSTREMSPFNRVRILLSPSFLSGSIAVLLTAYFAVATLIDSLKNNATFSSLADTFAGRIESLETDQTGLESIQSALSSGFTDNVGYIAVWAVIGLLVYMMVTLLAQGLTPVAELLNAGKLDGRYRREFVMQMAVSVALRLFFSIATIIYLVMLRNLIIPFSIGMLQLAVDVGGMSLIVDVIIACLVLLVGFQFVAVLLRLAFLRLRVFGGADYSK